MMPDNKKDENSVNGFKFNDVDIVKQNYTEILGAEETFLKTRNMLAKKYANDKSKTAQDIERMAAQATQRIWATSMTQKSAQEKKDTLKQKAEKIAATRQQVQQQVQILEQLASVDKENADAYKTEVQEKIKLVNQLAKQEQGVNSKIHRQEQLAAKQETQAKLNEIKTLSKSKSKYNKQQAKEQLKELNAQNKKQYDEALGKEKKLQQELKNLKKSGASDEEIAAKEQELSEASKATRAAGENMNATALKVAFNELGDQITQGIDAAMKAAEQIVTTSQSVINARLQGTDKTFQDMTDLVTDNLSISPLVEMEKVINSIQEASDKGIAYNIEQRAFLDTVSEKIADTFDAFDSNLMRLIRLQQADTTAARLGMEASLTKFFNSMFNDNSYLNDVADTIAGAVVDASSQMNKNAATEFEYVLQKWLGSLYSLGFSGDTLTQIATGINYLATGDVTSLANNSSLQTLMAMSASNAGLDFAEIMLNGLDAETTNKLLESMVVYLKDIAENSDNQVIKSAYGDIFDMSVSDLAAVSNLTEGDISTISGQMLSYNNMLAETTSQLAQITSRSSLSENISNIWKNVTFGMGMDMATNPAMWAMDKVLDFMKTNNIDMNIPYISVFGSGLDLNTTVVGLLETAYGFGQAMSLVGNILGGLGSSGGLDLSAWGGTEYNQRGNAIGGLLGTLIGGTSSSVYVNNNSSDDVVNESLSSATDDAEETEKITNKNAEKNDHTLDDFWEATVGEGASSYFKVQDDILSKVYLEAGNGGFLKTHDGILALTYDSQGNGGRLRVVDDSLVALFDIDKEWKVKDSVTNDLLSTILLYVQQINNNSQSSQEVKISSASTVNINERSLISAIVTALGGTGVYDKIDLKSFLNGTSQLTPTVSIAPNKTNQKIPVSIAEVSPGVKFNMQ